MLDANLKTQLKAYLQKVSRPIEIVASLDDGDKSRELQVLLEEIATLSDRITVIETHSDDERKPSFSISEPGRTRASASPAFRWAMNSRRSCWRCCKSAATGSSSTMP
jgi:alkyl hydroperoxide reductase subunit AhpF